MNQEALLEGLLFVVGSDGITLKQIAEVLEIDEAKALELLNQLEGDYQAETRGIHIALFGDTFKLTTKKEHKEIYQKLVEDIDQSFLSQAALETLAIIAYNEPVTRMQVDDIRGVSSSHMIRKLLNKNLIQEVGKSNLPGRPNLYGTTQQFLDYFGLSKKEDLPRLDPVEEKNEETDLFQSRYKEDE